MRENPQQFTVLFIAVVSLLAVLILMVSWRNLQKLIRRLRAGEEVKSDWLKAAKWWMLLWRKTDLEAALWLRRECVISLIVAATTLVGSGILWLNHGGIRTTQLPVSPLELVEVLAYLAGVFLGFFAAGYLTAKKKGRNGPAWGLACAASLLFALIVLILLPKLPQKEG